MLNKPLLFKIKNEKELNMPIYEYFCKECEIETEHIQNVGDDAPSCEICGRKLKKMISCSNFFLIGNGWGEDGYAKPKETKNV